MTCNSYLKSGFKVRATLGAMSYDITVESAGGQLHVTAAGPVPDGRHVISGHTGPDDVSLAVTRYDQAGVQLGSAGSYTRREA